jgi:hypothetical protein
VGQTAYIAGSHNLKLSAKIMTQEGGQEELEARLVRPHLQTGDAVLWDCRVLHFGLANQAPPTIETEVEEETEVKAEAEKGTTTEGVSVEATVVAVTETAATAVAGASEVISGEAEPHTIDTTRGASIDSLAGTKEATIRTSTQFCTDSWRPLLYVNYHQKWFHDPKNWNDKEKLFT